MVMPSLGGLNVDDEFELYRLPDRHVAGFCAFENLLDVPSRSPIQIAEVRPIRDKCAFVDELPLPVHSWQPSHRCHFEKRRSMIYEEGIVDHVQSLGTRAADGRECRSEFLGRLRAEMQFER